MVKLWGVFDIWISRTFSTKTVHSSFLCDVCSKGGLMIVATGSLSRLSVLDVLRGSVFFGMSPF
jgi:hypothetical protein